MYNMHDWFWFLFFVVLPMHVYTSYIKCSQCIDNIGDENYFLLYCLLNADQIGIQNMYLKCTLVQIIFIITVMEHELAS